MEAAFVILPDEETYNYVRGLQVKIRQLFGAKATLILEPHFTIKYGFEVSDLKSVEKYFDELVQNLKPFEVEINGIGSFETNVVFLSIVKNETLSRLHLKILKDVAQKFSAKPAEYEGKDFHFHITLAYEDISEATFKKILNYFKNEKPVYKFTVQKLGLYLRINPNENWFIYKIGTLR